MDAAEVGKRIRKLRKEKGIVLQDLSDLFSIGKLSNIEKGKIPVDIDDIKLICERLNVPLDSVVDVHSDQVFHDINERLNRIRSFITLNLFKVAKGLLKSTKSRIDMHGIKHLKAEINFYFGVYFIKRKNYSFAEVYFNEVIDEDTEFKHSSKFKIRSYNALSYIQFTRGKLSSALKNNNDALKYLHNRSIYSFEDEANVYFNKAIFNTHLGDYRTALRYANSAVEITKGHFHQIVRYFIAVLQILKGEYEAAEVNLKECIEYFQREELFSELAKSLITRYYLYHMNPQKFKSELEAIEVTIPKSMFTLENLKENPEMGRYAIPCLQIFIQVALEKKNYSFVGVLLEKLDEFQEAIPNDPYTYRTHYIKARFVRETTHDKQKEKELLEKALFYIKDREAIEKGLILHELGLLTEKHEGTFYESNHIFYTLLKKEHHSFNIIKHCVPEPRY